MKRKLKTAHDSYIDNILGLSYSEDPAASKSLTSKKLFSLLKNSKQDSTGIAPLYKVDKTLCTDNIGKSDILNTQFQSVFTAKCPLSLAQLSKMALQDSVDKGKVPSSTLPDDCKVQHPIMPNIVISHNGILKQLKDLNPHKAAGPDNIKPLVLRQLREEIAPIIQVIFQKSIDSGRVPKDWNGANVCPLLKKVRKVSPLITAPSH